MAELDDALSINVNEAPGIPSRKKGRFFGNKNFRNPNRAKYLGKRKRPTIISTSNVKLSDGKLNSVQNRDKSPSDGGKFASTALHFNAVDVIPGVKAEKIRKRLQIQPRKPASTATSKREPSEKFEANADKGVEAKTKSHGPWKSSLFNQNPEIPKVIQPDVSNIQEEMFSGEKFSELDIHPHLLSLINQKLKLIDMTSIQQKAIPLLLSGRDAMIKSQTGSGKTLAYAIPVIQNLQAIKPGITRKDGPTALILLPTRELALQSYEVFLKLTMPFCRIVPTWIIGGENRKSEKSRLRKGVNILIGTPGRILDHIQTTETLSLINLRWLILDEADRLLDMGFQKQIDAILKSLREQLQHTLQTVLLSATLSEKVERLADLALRDPAHIHVSGAQDENLNNEDDEIFALPEHLIQHVAIVPSKLRLVSLATFLKSQNLKKNKILVFLSCRDSVAFHHQLLKHVLRHTKIGSDFDVPFDIDLPESEVEEDHIFQLHGGMPQSERQDVFHNYSVASYGVLLTTDVAARGLDLPSVDWVIQYTSPGSPVDYIHRVGRTARAGKKGNSLLLLTPAEVKYVSLLTQFNIAVKEMNVDEILTSGMGVANKTKKNPVLWQKIVEHSKSDATTLQNQIESYVSQKVKIKTLARTAFMSFIRAYSTYPTEIKSIFHVKHLHLGHVAKSFGLRDAPKDVVKMLQKSVSHLPVKTSFEYREAKKEFDDAENDAKAKKELEEVENDTEKEPSQFQNNAQAREKPRLSRRQLMKNKMSRKPDLMSEFSSGIGTPSIPSKRAKH